MNLADVEKVGAVFDFRSSGLDLCQVEQLFMGEVCIANGLGTSWWGYDPIQVIVCEGCGHVRCEPGGWVPLRRAGDLVLWTPAFATMLEDGTEEYNPPGYVAVHGAPAFDAPNYRTLRGFAPALPEAEQVKPLTAWEAIRLLQWEAPDGVLGRFPELARLNREHIAAASEGDLDAAIAGLNRLLQAHADSRAGVRLRPVEPDETPLTFTLDRPGYPEWRALVGGEAGFRIFFEPGLVVEFLSEAGRGTLGSTGIATP